jgi:hypothetical protein
MNRAFSSLTGIAHCAAAAALMLSIGMSSPASATRGSDRGDRGEDSFRNLKIIGLTEDGRLVSFNAGLPNRSKNLPFVSGFVGEDTALVGIDYRVQDGLLYGVGNGGGVYTIDPRSGQANLVTTLTVPLSGERFGVDFNPAADALRVISDNGQNLRHPFSGSTKFVTQVDGPLTYPATTTTPETIAEGVSAAAYTNNDLNANTSTTLFDIDTSLDQIVIQAPANAGLLSATGKLGVNASANAGFDIYSTLRRDATVKNDAFATLSVNGRYSLYQVNLLTGKASSLGSYNKSVVDIAVPLNQR